MYFNIQRWLDFLTCVFESILFMYSKHACKIDKENLLCNVPCNWLNVYYSQKLGICVQAGWTNTWPLYEHWGPLMAPYTEKS